MLNIYMPAYTKQIPPGKPFECFDEYFVQNISDDWFTEDVRAALRGIERGVYMHNGAFATQQKGIIPADWVSSGFKMLTCIANVDFRDWTDIGGKKHTGEDWYIEASHIQNGAYKYLGPTVDALQYDLNLQWNIVVDPTEIGDAPINGRLVGTDFTFKSWKEFASYASADLHV